MQQKFSLCFEDSPLQIKSIISNLARVIGFTLCCAVPAGAYAGTLDTIKAAGEVKIGYRESSQPVSYLNKETNEPTGFVVQLCKQIVAVNLSEAVKKPLKIKFVPVTAQNRLKLLLDGSIDMECGSTTVTQDRLKQVDFSLVTFVTTSRMVSLAATNASSLKTLVGKTLAVKTGSSHIDLISRMIADVKVIQVTDARQGVEAVTSGKAQAYLDDEVLIQSAIHKQGLDSAKFAWSTPFSVEPYGIAIRQNDPDFARLVNAGLRATFNRSEKAIAMLDTYTSELGVPINTLTRDAIRSPSKSRQCSLLEQSGC